MADFFLRLVSWVYESGLANFHQGFSRAFARPAETQMVQVGCRMGAFGRGSAIPGLLFGDSRSVFGDFHAVFCGRSADSIPNGGTLPSRRYAVPQRQRRDIFVENPPTKNRKLRRSDIIGEYTALPLLTEL